MTKVVFTGSMVTSDDNWFDCEVQALVEEGEGDEVGMKVDANVMNAIIDRIWKKPSDGRPGH